jgi:hypothetical protein
MVVVGGGSRHILEFFLDIVQSSMGARMDCLQFFIARRVLVVAIVTAQTRRTRAIEATKRVSLA